MRTIHSLHLLLALLAIGSLAEANGVLTIRGGGGNVAQSTHAVKAAVRDRFAQVTVEQTFRNESSSRLEGIYVFPLPDGASVTEFAMTMGGKMVKGQVLERGKAKRVYESIVSRKRDPGLLEQIDRGVFRARVFPIEPRSDIKIRVVYQQILPEHDGVAELRYPLAAERMGAGKVAAVTIEVGIRSSASIDKIHCASHRAAIERETDHKASVKWSAEVDSQDRDFLLYIARDRNFFGLSLASHKAPAEDGSFLATFRIKSATGKPQAKDVTYVLDTSGSMKGPKLDQAKAALKHGLDMLLGQDRFNVIAFSTTTRGFRDGLVQSTPETRAAAKAWIDGLEAEGGTAIADALEAAVSSGDPERLGIVAFLTDGSPTVGEQDTDKILAGLARANNWNKRVFVFGIGFDQAVPLLDRIALQTRAAREYVSEKQSLEVVVRRFFARIDQPALTDVSLDLPDSVVDVFPPRLPDLFAGDELVVSGRYKSAGPVLMRLHGKAGGRSVTYVYEGTFSDKPDLAGIERVWAQKKVDFLLAQKESDEVRNEIVRLATRHSIVTRYTAGLVVEDSELPAERIVQNDTDFSASEEVSDTPFTGPSSNSAIGLGGGAGGSMRGRGGHRNLRAGGGSGMTESHVETGLKWLADHQAADGDWGGAENTGLALLGFLGAGYTDRGSVRENKCAKNVRNGLRKLMADQTDKGRLSDDLKSHAIATTALCEAYWMTRNPRYRKPAQVALDYLSRNRTPTSGWGDFRTTAWAALALKTGRFGGLDIDPDGFEAVRKTFDVADAPPAFAIVSHIMLGESPRASQKIAALMQRLPADTLDKLDAEELLFAVHSAFQVGGAYWKAWNQAMKKALVNRKPTEVKDAALHALCMEVYYRYDRIFSRVR